MPDIGLYSFEIFEDGVRPPIGFGSTGSRSIRSADPQNPIPEPNMKYIRWPVYIATRNFPRWRKFWLRIPNRTPHFLFIFNSEF